MKHKHADVIIAWANGAQIQVKAHNVVWEDRENPVWSVDREYRIKPEPKPDVVERVLLWRIDRCGMTQPVGEFRLVTDGETGKLKSAEVL